MVTVGVLALQGDFSAHRRALARLGAASVAVRKPADLAGVDALVLPGGESTAMLRGMDRDHLETPLADFMRSGRPVLGTCAGAILLARRVRNPPQRSFGALDIDVEAMAPSSTRSRRRSSPRGRWPACSASSSARPASVASVPTSRSWRASAASRCWSATARSGPRRSTPS